MSDDERRAGRGTQRERVFAHKDRILELLDQGARHVTIKDDLGLQDIPRTTFQYLVHSIRSEAADRLSVQGNGSSGPEGVSPPFSAFGNTSSKVSEAGALSQPKRVAADRSGNEPPRQPASRKRRTGFVVPQSRDAKDLNLDPSKWKTDP